jgi:predicted nucleotidyltransferase
MNTRDIIRTAVVKTNLHWPFSTLNRMPYYLAIKALTRSCKRFPEIKSVYLRHGLTEDNWVPALSDIDLTIITDSRLSIEEEFSFLSSFWKNYDRMKKLFPMLGEVEILNDEHIGSWTKFNIRGYESRNWKLIHGIETANSNYIVHSTRLAIDSLNHALWVYLDHFLRRFYLEEFPSFMALQEMQRLAFKALKYANYFHVHPLKHKLDGRVDNKTAMLCCVLEELEKGVRLFAPTFDQNGLRKNPREWQVGAEFSNISSPDQALDTRELEPFHEAIESIFFTYATSIVVLTSGLDASVTKGCIDMVNRILPKGGITPVIVNSRILDYMLRFYSPFLYTDLVRRNSVAYGKDLLPEIQPPGMHHFISQVLEQTATVLAFPQSRAVISPPNPSWFSEQQLDSILKRSLFIKMYLEKGVIKPSHNELLAECQSSYPDYYEKLKEIKGLNEEALSEEAFRLLRGITSDIHRSISTSDVVDNVFKIDEGECSNK